MSWLTAEKAVRKTICEMNKDKESNHDESLRIKRMDNSKERLREM